MSTDPRPSLPPSPELDWLDGPIQGCRILPVKQYRDDRGWLAEFFRQDEMNEELFPAMGYLSLTRPGVSRGPHEHEDQTDLFVFFSGAFRLYLWDARSFSPTYGHRQIVDVGAENPCTVLVPPGVVHAYRNVGTTEGLIVNCPNRLYGGWGKQGPVDEIRYEDAANTPYSMP